MIRRINELLQITRRGIGELGRKVVKEFTYPPESKVECNDTRELEIFELNKAVEILRNQALYGEICLCKDEFHAIESRIYKQLPECKTGEKDYTKTERPDKDAYIKANPYCVAYETWAEYLSAQCKRVKLDFKVIEKKCSDVDLDLHGTNFVTCDAIDLAIAIENKTCNVDIDPKVDLQQCVVDFVANVIPRGCDVSLETFVEKVSCGVDVKTILREVGCDVDLHLTSGDAICPSSSSLSPSASASPSEVCDFDYQCAILDVCAVSESVEYHYNNYGADEMNQYIDILNATNRPTFTINCGACSFVIRPEFWETTIEFNEGSPAFVINGSYDLSAGTALDACADIDNAESYYAFQILPLSECGLLCDEDHTDCITACLGDLGCEDDCNTVQGACYVDCINALTLSVPSADCCSEGYSATLISSDISTGAGYISCETSPADLLYFDFTWTFEDSLGNSITCDGRYFTAAI